MAKSPVSVVKEKFGDKAKLVEAVKAFMTEDLWVNRLNEEKGLDRVSNAKLLRLHRIFSAVQGEFGAGHDPHVHRRTAVTGANAHVVLPTAGRWS